MNSPRRLPRLGLVWRFGAASALTVLLAALVLGPEVVQRVSDADTRRVLRMVAEADVARLAAGEPAKPERSEATGLDRVVVARATLRRRADGAVVVTGAPLAREGLTPDQAARVVRGEEVSTVVRRDGVAVFVEARPSSQGGLVAAQRRPDGLAQSVLDRALPAWTRAALAVALAGALAAAALAWLTGRPLRRLTGAAADLAAGRRDVALPERGPAEVAALSREINALALALAHEETRQREFLSSAATPNGTSRRAPGR